MRRGARSPHSRAMKDLTSSVIAVVALASLAGCHIFDKHSPKGHLARVDPAQDANNADPMSPMNVTRNERRSISSREAGTLHVWLHYMCSVPQQGELQLSGTLGLENGANIVPPVPVTVTSQGATLTGLPRSGSDAFTVGNQTRIDDRTGGRSTHGFVYLFDVEATSGGTFSITGSLTEGQGTRCMTMSHLELWKD